MWLYLAFIGYTALALVGILDKFILSSEKVKPIVFVFYSTVFAVPVLLAAPFGVRLLSMTSWPLAVIGGVSYSCALYTMYKGYQESEVSHVGPLIGAAIPFFVLLLSSVFLEEQVHTRQVVAIAVLIAGCLVISFEQSKLHNGWHRGMLWGIASGLFYSFFFVIAKYLYTTVGFFSGFVWLWGSMGVSGLLLLLSRTARGYIFGASHHTPKIEKKPMRTRHALLFIIGDKVLSVVGVVFIQLAIAMGSVSVVNAMVGLQYALLIVFVALLSKFVPRFFREEYAAGEALQESVAVVLIIIGLGLLLT